MYALEIWAEPCGSLFDAKNRTSQLDLLRVVKITGYIIQTKIVYV